VARDVSIPLLRYKELLNLLHNVQTPGCTLIVGLRIWFAPLQELPWRFSFAQASGNGNNARRLMRLLALIFLLPSLYPLRAVGQATPSDLMPLATIQGAGAASSFQDQHVTTWGLVTGVTSDGFYLQDPLGDGDPSTSDALFVYTWDAPTVATGQCIRAVGQVIEFYAKTELNRLDSITPSTECGAEVVIPFAYPEVRPGDDPANALEALEGMVVRLNALTGTVHGPTKHFASGEQELAFMPDPWPRYLGPVHLFHDQPAVTALLFLSNRLGATLPNVRWGDQVQVGNNGLVGVLDYNFGKYQLLPLPDQSVTASAGKVDFSPLPAARADEYGVCSFNLHGFGHGEEQFPNPSDYNAALQQRAEVIARDLPGCTVIALQETGTPDDAEALAHMLASEHGLAYSALAVGGPSSNDADFPLTNSFLVDSTRVSVELVDSVEGCTTQDFALAAPGLCPVGQYPVFARPPVMAQLVIASTGKNNVETRSRLWVINNHWKSKSGDERANARLRLAQATVVAERVQEIIAVDPAAQIMVVGDLNDFYGDAAVATLQSATGLFHLYEWLPPLDRYSYIFNGAAQVLDHLLVTPNLATEVALVQIVHLHADAPLAASDHDPVVVRVRPGGAAVVGGDLGWGGIHVTAGYGNGTVAAQAVTDAHGLYRLWGLPVGGILLKFDAPEWIVFDHSAQPGSQTTVGQTIDATAGMMMLNAPRSRHMSAITGAWLALNTPWLVDSVLP
jgi:hypothetical protein